MPFLDVSDVLLDPDFADTFSVIRSNQVVSSSGLASNTGAVTTTGVSGVVTPDRGRAMQRLAEGQHVTDAIKIYTAFRLTTGNGPLEADQIVWNGANYVVVSVMDYSRFGAGFICATCDLTDINPAGP